MGLTVNERAKMIATFRFVEVRLMEITAAWTPTTPEMEVKVMFGRHIWDFAQHADLLGKRTFELRQPEHYTLRAVDEYVTLVEQVADEADTSVRLGALYDAILPGLEQRYRSYLASTDRLLDEPTIVIIERILADIGRMRKDFADVRQRIQSKPYPAEPIRKRELAIGEITA